jgi:hypothetical protein
MATLVLEKEVACPPDLAVGRIYRAFGAETARNVTLRLVVPFEDLGLPNVGEFSREVVVTLGEPERKRFLTRIPLSWKVPENHAFPVFRGFFEVQPQSSRHVQLALLGYYHPPYGIFGAAFDALLGRKIAEATVRHLLEEIAEAVAEREHLNRHGWTRMPA